MPRKPQKLLMFQVYRQYEGYICFIMYFMKINGLQQKCRAQNKAAQWSFYFNSHGPGISGRALYCILSPTFTLRIIFPYFIPGILNQDAAYGLQWNRHQGGVYAKDCHSHGFTLGCAQIDRKGSHTRSIRRCTYRRLTICISALKEVRSTLFMMNLIVCHLCVLKTVLI